MISFEGIKRIISEVITSLARFVRRAPRQTVIYNIDARGADQVAIAKLQAQIDGLQPRPMGGTRS